MNVDDISGLFFLDTNILVYTFDDRTPCKRATAREWVREGLASGRGVIGTQVAQEFLNVATGKFQTPISQSDSREYINPAVCGRGGGLSAGSFPHESTRMGRGINRESR